MSRDCRRDNRFDAAIAWSEPTNADLQEQVLLQSDLRSRVTGSMHFSLDVALLMPSVSRELDDSAVV
jgi:hypothetical protein